MELKDYIKRALSTYYGLIDERGEGAADTRYRSWQWCYLAFSEGKAAYAAADSDAEREKIVDYLALSLGFYLASWGMYRGSSFLLQRDYKAHKAVVLMLLFADECLFAYAPNRAYGATDVSRQNELLFGRDGLYFKIRSAYSDNSSHLSLPDSDGSGDIATDTLVTKILMGTLGCVPAFDRFFKVGIAWLKKKLPFAGLTQSIENGGKTYRALENIAYEYKDSLVIENSGYPVMKCLDMFLWQVGFELDIRSALAAGGEVKVKNLINAAKALGISGETKSEVISSIGKRWGLDE